MLLLPCRANLQINSCYTSATPSTVALPHPHPLPTPRFFPTSPSPALTHLSHIISPLTKHPHQTPCTHNHRPSQRLPPPRRAEHKPLRRKVRKRNGIRPDSELVERRLVDVVRGVEPDYAREERPGPERARREPGDVVGFARWRVECGWVVDARGVREGAVGLD